MTANNKWRANNPVKVKLYRHNRELALRNIIPDATVTAKGLFELLAFQNNQCNLCLKDISFDWTIDHIIPLNPKKTGGKHTIYNIQLLCKNCNSKKQDKMSEADIQYACLQYLRLNHIFCWKAHTVGIKKESGSYIPSGMRGVSDILGILPDGRFLAVECKKPKNKLSEFQREFLENIKNNGGVALVVYSLDDLINAHNNKWKSNI